MAKTYAMTVQAVQWTGDESVFDDFPVPVKCDVRIPGKLMLITIGETYPTSMHINDWLFYNEDTNGCKMMHNDEFVKAFKAVD